MISLLNFMGEHPILTAFIVFMVCLTVHDTVVNVCTIIKRK